MSYSVLTWAVRIALLEALIAFYENGVRVFCDITMGFTKTKCEHAWVYRPLPTYLSMWF